MSCSRKFLPSADATITCARFSLLSSRHVLISSSTSDSSSIFGLANTANPTFLTASIQGRITSELPGVMFVNIAPCGLVCSSCAMVANHFPMASKRGRYCALGLPPSIAPSPMSMFGASQISRVVFCVMFSAPRGLFSEFVSVDGDDVVWLRGVFVYLCGFFFISL